MTAVAVIRSIDGAGSKWGEGDTSHGGVRRSVPTDDGRHPKMQLIPESGDPFEVPYAPRGSQVEGIVPEWATVTRGGREPLLLRAGDNLPTMSFDLIFGYWDPQESISHELDELRDLAESGARMRVRLDSVSAHHRWRLTGFSQEIIARQQGTNLATRAVCSLTFTVASDQAVRVGPLSGGKKGSGKKHRIPKTYVIKKGDTLQAIARRFYDDVSVWRDIADLNHIRHPKDPHVGKRIRLPRRKDLDK